jgi:hypothetical protein
MSKRNLLANCDRRSLTWHKLNQIRELLRTPLAGSAACVYCGTAPEKGVIRCRGCNGTTVGADNLLRALDEVLHPRGTGMAFYNRGPARRVGAVVGDRE